MKKQQFFIRNIEAGKNLEIFFVSAIAAILLIRLFLEITGYPKLGGGQLHIAHMLWGGVLMLVALFIILTFIGKRTERLSAIIGGLGFGTFIDEIGKLITQDNDYFFQPSIAIIYIVFILIFLLIRSIQNKIDYSPIEYLMNAIYEMEEIANQNLDEDEKEQIAYYLSKSKNNNPLVSALEKVLENAELVPISPPGLFKQSSIFLREGYRRIASTKWFTSIIISFFLIQLSITFIQIMIIILFNRLGLNQIFNIGIFDRIAERLETLTFIDWAEILSSLLSAIFIFLGILLIKKDTLRAFRMFERSILISIFLTQVFVFYKEQFSGLFGFAINILILIAIKFFIKKEKHNLSQY